MWDPKQLIPYSRSDLRITRHADSIIMSSPFCSSRRSRALDSRRHDQPEELPGQEDESRPRVHQQRFDASSQLSLDISDVSHVSTISDLSSLIRKKDTAFFSSLSASNDSSDFPNVHRGRDKVVDSGTKTTAERRTTTVAPEALTATARRLPHVEQWLLNTDAEPKLFAPSKSSSSSAFDPEKRTKETQMRLKNLEDRNFQLQRDKTNLLSQLQALKELKRSHYGPMSSKTTAASTIEWKNITEDRHRLEVEVERLKVELAKKDLRFEELAQGSEEKDQELSRLRDALKKHKEIDNSNPHPNTSNSKDINELESRVSDVVVSMPNSVRELTEGIEALMNDLSAKEEELKESHLSLQKLQEELETVKIEKEAILSTNDHTKQQTKYDIEALKQALKTFGGRFDSKLIKLEQSASNKMLDLEQKLSNAASSLMELKLKVDSEMLGKEEMRRRYQRELKALNSELDQRPNVCLSEYILVQSKLHQVVQLESENSELKSDNERLRECKQELSDRLIESEKLFTAEIEKLAMDIRDREELLNTMRLDIARVECDLSDTKKSLDSVSATKIRIEEEQSSTLAHLEHQTEDCSTLRKALVEKTRLLSQTESEWQSVLSENTALIEELDSIRHRNGVVEMQMEQLSKVLEESERSHEELNCVLQMQVNRLQGFINEFEGENEQLKKDKVELEGQILNLEQQNGLLVQKESVENEELRETVDRLQCDLEADARLRQELGASLEIAKKHLRLEVEDVRSHLEIEKNKRVEAELKLQNFELQKSEFETLKSELEALKVERDGYKQQMSEMNQALRSSLGHIKHLRSKGSHRSPSTCSSSALESETELDFDKGLNVNTGNSTSLQQCLVSLKAEMLLLQSKLAPKYRAPRTEDLEQEVVEK